MSLYAKSSTVHENRNPIGAGRWMLTCLSDVCLMYVRCLSCFCQVRVPGHVASQGGWLQLRSLGSSSQQGTSSGPATPRAAAAAHDTGQPIVSDSCAKSVSGQSGDFHTTASVLWEDIIQVCGLLQVCFCQACCMYGAAVLAIAAPRGHNLAINHRPGRQRNTAALVHVAAMPQVLCVGLSSAVVLTARLHVTPLLCR